MSPPSVSLIEDLTPNEIEKLTQVLVLPPKTEPHPIWLKDQANLIPILPPKLRRSQSILPRLAMSIPFGTQKAHLCAAHKQLNPYLVRRIFLQVSAECTTRISRFVSNPYLPANIAIHVKALQTANSLWMSSDLYRVTFQCQPEEERFDRIASDCEACILAAVGGNLQILQDLRTSMLGRKKKSGKGLRLLPLVEGWIEWTGAGDRICEESDALARELRNCRRQMQEARRQKRRNKEVGIVNSTPLPHPPPDDSDMNSSILNHDAAAAAFDFAFQEHDGANDDNDLNHDPEGSIIDYYANRLSYARETLNRPQDQTSIHPAFRSSLSLVFQYQTHSSSNSSTTRDRPLPPRPSNPTAYTDSETSLRNTYTHRGAAAQVPAPRVHQPPPAAHHNRMHQKQKSTRRNTGYTESVYSSGSSTVRGNGNGNTNGYAPSVSQESSYAAFQDRQVGRRARSTEEQAGEYRGLLDVDDYRDPEPREREDRSGDAGEGSRRRDTKVTSFGDFI
ncbi:uncharacterized protein RSE6_00147 [Rhynchosporium secalis]|uniref:Uncharacterized protein n=1 Tax=Rhynchosporium secalis TaxID=38038 RepID=A0A1E1LUK1_RHYSE|nr:uncharacterized protein RSE6_00147 [Rhynchosporium secalis]